MSRPTPSVVLRPAWTLALALLFASGARAEIAPRSLRADLTPDAVELSWNAGVGPYAVYRSVFPEPLAVPPNLLGTTADLSYDDPLSPLTAPLYFYLVGDPPECTDDPDCDDGNPCNGIEQCDTELGVCVEPPLLARSLVDRPDDHADVQVHMTYVLPSDGADQQLDTVGQLEDEVQVAQSWLYQQVGRCLRFDTYNGSLDVTFARLSRTNEEIRTDPAYVDQSIALELEGLELDDPDKLYVVYYGGTTDADNCGGAAAVGGPAMLFLVERASPGAPLTPCPYFSFVSGPADVVRGPDGVRWAGVMLHEGFHTVGVVPACAPDHDDAHPMHLATISSDIMAYDGTGFDYYSLDVARTQYFDHGNPGCLDLANSAVWYGAPVDPDPLPGKTHYVDPLVIDCREEPGVSSVPGGAPATLRFANVTDRTVRFYWLDFAGNRQPSEVLQPYSDLCCGSTAEFHVFVATDDVTEECLGIYEIRPGLNRILIVD